MWDKVSVSETWFGLKNRWCRRFHHFGNLPTFGHPFRTHLVDLAGSERAGRTKATGDRPGLFNSSKLISLFMIVGDVLCSELIQFTYCSVTIIAYYRYYWVIKEPLLCFWCLTKCSLPPCTIFLARSRCWRLKEGAAINQSLSTLARRVEHCETHTYGWNGFPNWRFWRFSPHKKPDGSVCLPVFCIFL